jgi:hypothetical protein
MPELLNVKALETAPTQNLRQEHRISRFCELHRIAVTPPQPPASDRHES